MCNTNPPPLVYIAFRLGISFNSTYAESVIDARENIDINTVTDFIVSYTIFIYIKRQLKEV